MSKTNYTQCTLVRGDMHQTAFIPSKFAVMNEVLKIKTHTEWIDGWVVTQVGQEVDQEYIDAMRRMWKKHRQFSDVARGTIGKLEVIE